MLLAAMETFGGHGAMQNLALFLASPLWVQEFFWKAGIDIFEFGDPCPRFFGVKLCDFMETNRH